MNRYDYYTESEWQQLISFSQGLPTPFILIDLNRIKKQYHELSFNFPGFRIYYSVKANPAPEILSLLSGMDCNFDIASRYELDKVLALGVTPDKLLFGNTIKKAQDIEYCFNLGIRLFASDCLSDLKNLALYAPGSGVYIRILVQGEDTSDWPLSKKFGCHPDNAINLLKTAKKMGLAPKGISFHVGSQQRDIKKWELALAEAAKIFDLARNIGIKLDLINMGGGFPANYVNKTPSLNKYAVRIQNYLKMHFGEHSKPNIILEPGRSLVGNAGVLVTEIITVAKKNKTDSFRWVYVDAGKFNGLIETLEEGIKYPVVIEGETDHKRTGEVILAGPTCDSVDIMYEKSKYRLPMNAKPGQRLYWLSTGAYTASYASVEFNGFPPIKSYFLQ